VIMRVNAGILIIISLFLLVGVSSAHLPDGSTISTSEDWVVANGADTATITVYALNSTSGAVKNALVQFSVDNPKYGSVSPLSDTTDNSGKAKSTFRVNKTSGVVNITARITADGYTVTRQINVNIDHDTPYYPYFTHPLSGTVATDVPFNVSITDRWGNPIDNRRGPHPVSLHVHGPAPDDCGFRVANTSQHSITGILSADGNATFTVRLTTKVGPNNILMDAFGSIPDKLEWINADTTGIPFSITQVYSPSGSPPALPADGTSKFTIIYSLFDRYGNPSSKQWVWVNTTITGEEQQFESNTLGQISITYGPKVSIGTVTITATTVANSTVTASQLVEFVNTAATTMELTANPETMASRDVNPAITADIIASVIDEMGNPVENETVTFSMGTVRYPGGPYNVTSLPSISSTSKKTDADGHAIITFIPGSFSTVNSSTATGNVTITAVWNGTPKNIVATWKNYPYLSVKTSVMPPIIAVNDTVEVRVDVLGDGWALQPKPVDVVLCTDRSGSMLYDNPDRMYSIREAAKVFVDQLSASRDYVGLVTFGRNGYISRPGVNSGIALSEINNVYTPSFKTYSDYATVDNQLTNAFTVVKNSLNGILPDHGTPMRSAIYKSVNEINSRGRTNTVKAIILLSDGDYNWYGDPLARGTGNSNSETSYTDLTTSYKTFPGLGSGQFSNQNMSVYAKNNGIRIYSIAFANSMSAGGKQTLETLALATGGKYYTASATDITDVYKQIAGDLKEEAGVDTTMVVDQESINVTGVPTPGKQVFTYLYHPTYSTRTGWQDGVVNVTNQTADWADDNKLGFTIGTIKVGQTWNTTFRLKANQSGSIDVFGSNSKLSFNGGVSTLTLPHTFLTVIPQLNMTTFGAKTLTLSNLSLTETGEITTTLPLTWNTSYTGNKTIIERVSYSIDNGPYVLFDTIAHPYPFAPDIVSATEYVDHAQLDVRKLPPGGYKIMVYATASDSPDDCLITDAIRVGGTGKTYIKLEAPPVENFEIPWGGISLPLNFNSNTQIPLGICRSYAI
jgi:hypothetical protein